MVFSRPLFGLLSTFSIGIANVNAAPNSGTVEQLQELHSPKAASSSKPPVSAAPLESTLSKKAMLKISKPARPFRLIVPAMGLDMLVARGTDNAALRLAPGYDPVSAMPGEAGNCVVASHRNVHGAYFWYLTEVKPGALITIQTPRETLNYKVVSAGLIHESQTDLLDNRAVPGAPPRLTLYTCTLPVSPRRLVVIADLVARGVPSPGDFRRPAAVREITSGPLRLLKDKVLHERYQSLLRYAGENEKAAKENLAKERVAKDKATKNEAAPVALSSESVAATKVVAAP